MDFQKTTNSDSGIPTSIYQPATNCNRRLETHWMSVVKQPDLWEREWMRSELRVLQAQTDEPVTPWFGGGTYPERIGFYERMFSDGVFRHYWDGANWLIGGPNGKPHWLQVGDYPVWRGLAAKAT